MGAAFNALADAAEDQEKLRQGFAAEVAHELRTPLTILRSQVEGLRVGVLEPTPGALTSLDEEARRMSWLVADLQILGSADAAGFSLEVPPWIWPRWPTRRPATSPGCSRAPGPAGDPAGSGHPGGPTGSGSGRSWRTRCPTR